MIGVSAAAVAAVVPAVAAPLVEAPIKPFPKYPGPFYYLYPSEWAHFERAGFNMDLCRRIEMIPTTGKGDIWTTTNDPT